MAKSSGIGWTSLNVDAADTAADDITNDITNQSWTMPRSIQDITGLDSAARETLLLLADFSITMAGVFNPDLSHVTFATISTTDVPRTVANVISAQTLTAECNLTDYALTRAPGGEFTFSVPGVLQDGTAPAWSS